MLEIETKIIDINPTALRKRFRLKRLRFEGREKLMRWVFTTSNNKNGLEFVRVRTNGKKSTLTYKSRKSDAKSLRNTEEIETTVEDFSNTANIISKLIKNGKYYENIRETYRYKGMEITINKWPDIPAYLEIEGPSTKSIRKAIKGLGVTGKEIGNVGIMNVYKYYGKELHHIKMK
jgi:adenylate cyclase, class 2